MVALMALTRSLMERRPMPGVDDAGDGAVIDEGVGCLLYTSDAADEL